MKVVVVLAVSFLLSLLAIKWLQNRYNWQLAGAIAMGIMLLFTSLGHFMFAKGMSMMLPPFIPFKTALVYLTGIIEIAAAIGLFIPSTRPVTGWLLIIFFILILPANIYGAIKHIDFEKAALNGNGPSYLWFRIPLQVLFILWTYLCTIYQIIQR
ncbi:MAG: hypothetical protein QM731_07865 [Chitinophagaceae bacterium]